MTNASAAPAQQTLAKLVQDAQAILADHHQPVGPSKAETIEKLTTLLAGAEATIPPAELSTKFSAAIYISALVLCVGCAAVIGHSSKELGTTDYFQRVAGSCK